MVSSRFVAIVAPLAVAAMVVVNAWPGLMPGVGFWDTGEFQTVLPVLGTAHPTGYPTYVILGFIGNILLTPIGEPAFRVTVLSLLAVAVAAAATVLLIRRLTGSTIIGIATGLGLALTPVVWANATRADPHPIHLAFVAVLLLVLVRWEDARRELARPAPATADASTEAAIDGAIDPTATSDSRAADRWLVLAAIVFGLAAGNHSLTLLLVPPIALYVLAVEPRILRRGRFVLACIGAAAATVGLVYLELPIRGGLIPAPIVYGRPATVDGFWYIALAEQFRGSLGNPFDDLARKAGELVTFANSQLGVLTLAIPPAIIVAARRAPRYLLLTGLAVVITVLFNEAYSNADINRYYLGPILVVWTWLGILAAEVASVVGFVGAAAAARLRASRAGSSPVDRATIVVAVVLGIALLVPTIGDLDRRRHDTGIDRSGDVAAQRWLDEVLPALAPNAVLVSWWSTSTPMWYAQHVLGQRRDIFVVDDRTMLDQNLGRAPDVVERYLDSGRPVYAIRLVGRDIDELLGRFLMTKVASDGNTAVYLVQGRLVATP
jgi:hypothetical protein